MLSLRTIQERVRKSAILLDSEKPNWYRLISLPDLNMNDFNNCIVGQISRNAMDKGGIWHLNDMDKQRGFYIGYFDCPVEMRDNRLERLGQMWAYQIKKRLRCDEKKAIDAMYRC